MGDECLDNCLSIDASEDAFKEKTRMAEVAATTLCKLNGIMKQMKNWRDDRAKLKCNICRLKLALRAAGKETNDTLQADPLVEDQREEIKRLEAANETLKKEVSDIKSALIEARKDVTRDNAWKYDERLLEIKREFFVERERLSNEVLYLKNRLKEIEEEHEQGSALEHLRCKLKEFMMGDQTMDMIFADMVSKVVETIANLSEELVNLSEHLQRSKLKNDDLYFEIDSLKAMIRSRSGNTVDYQKRIHELDNITKRLKEELDKLLINFEKKSCNETLEYPNTLKNAERLANVLKKKLKNDHEALLAAGDPDCLKYMKKIIELRVNLKYLYVELDKSDVEVRSRSFDRTLECNKHCKRISTLEGTLKQIDAEIYKLKDDHVLKQVSGIEGVKYLNKIEQLEIMIEKARLTTSSLNSSTRMLEEKDVEKLENLIENVCREIKELEVIVASNNCWTLTKRIEQLEESIVQSKIESTEKDDRANVLRQEFSATKTALEQKTKELKDTQKKVSVLTEETKTFKERTKKMEEKMLKLLHEQEDTKKDLEELQQVKHETNVIRKKLRNVQVDKEALLKETDKMRNALANRNEEIAAILAKKDTTEKILSTEIANLNTKLQIALEDNEKLQRKIDVSKEQDEKESSKRSIDSEQESGNTKHSELAQNAQIEVERLKLELDTSRKNLDNANREIIDLRARLDHFSSDKEKLETNILHLEAKKEILVYQLGAEKTAGEERLKEFTKLMLEHNESENEKGNLKRENERLKLELTGLRAEKDLTMKSMEDVNKKYSILEDKVNNYESECNALREEISKFKTSTEELTSKLAESRVEMEDAGDKIKRLRLENSRLSDNLDGLTLKNTDVEARVQVLLTEKNDLATRINDLNEGNVALKDQLNKVKAENEYSSIELNKSRIENEKTKSKNAVLQDTLEETRRSNETLGRINEELRARLNEIQSEYRILDNQLKILRMKNDGLRKDRESLCRENNALKNYYFNKSNLPAGIPGTGKEEFAIVSDAILAERDDRDEECAPGKTGNNEKQDDTKSRLPDKHGSQDKVKTKEKTRNEVKKLRAENEALKFELINSRTRNSEIRLELSRTKDEFEKLRIELTRIKTYESGIRPVSNKLEIVNLYYKHEVNSYSTRCTSDDNRSLASDSSTNRIDRLNDKNMNLNGPEVRIESRVEMEDRIRVIDKLKIENVALRMEVTALRCNVVASFSEEEKSKRNLRNAVEEIQALKLELTKLRDEKESLSTRLDTARTELDKLKTERVALKDELVTLRKTNSELRHKAGESQNDYQKLKKTSGELEDRIIGAMNEIQKYTKSVGNLDDFDDQFKILVQKYCWTKGFLGQQTSE